MIKRAIITLIIILLLIIGFYYASKTITKHTGYVTANTIKQIPKTDEINKNDNRNQENKSNNQNINLSKGG
jgi:hypothetical protein